jgi:phage tail-like protein|tara:strand:- start:645 stop:1091 length:447 start_codon:yes stop_codon:yes gene_type:complete
MSLTAGDALTAFSFEFSIDGTTIPNVVEVNNISKGTSTIETRSMTPEGTYVLQQMLGPRESGSLVLTVLNTGDANVTSWLMQGIDGDFAGARKTGKLVYKDTMGKPVLTTEFENVMVTKLDYGDLKAGSAEHISMTISMTFTDMKTTS